MPPCMAAFFLQRLNSTGGGGRGDALSSTCTWPQPQQGPRSAAAGRNARAAPAACAADPLLQPEGEPCGDALPRLRGLLQLPRSPARPPSRPLSGLPGWAGPLESFSSRLYERARGESAFGDGDGGGCGLSMLGPAAVSSDGEGTEITRLGRRPHSVMGTQDCVDRTCCYTDEEDFFEIFSAPPPPPQARHILEYVETQTSTRRSVAENPRCVQ